MSLVIDDKLPCLLESIVGILIADDGELVYCLSTSSFAEAAHHPASLWVSVEKSLPIHDMLATQGRFSLAVLHLNQANLAQQYSTGLSKKRNTLGELNIYESKSGFLFLGGALSSTGCKTTLQVDLGTHSLFIANIVEADLDSSQSYQRQLLTSDVW